MNTNGRYKWYSLPDEDDGTSEVLPVDFIHETRWMKSMCELGLGTGYWATESSYDYQSPIWKDGQFTKKPQWAVHIAWFVK
jgi:hypothetical protein